MWSAEGFWRATRTPEGPATMLFRQQADRLQIQAWGEGAAWATERGASIAGLDDAPWEFRPADRLVAGLHRRFGGLRLTRTQAVFESLVPTVLEQKVPGIQARSAYRQLVLELGERAPGPVDLRVPPSPAAIRALPYWAWHRFGVERRRADTIRRAAMHAGRLEESVTMAPADALRRLTVLPGLGPWSAAEVAVVALGDPDAVSVGDFHLPHVVSWALAGQARGTDERMLELLEPFRGHRGRVLRLLTVAGIMPPRFGPRMPLRRISAC